MKRGAYRDLVVFFLIFSLLASTASAVETFQFAIPAPQPAMNAPVGNFVDSSGKNYAVLQDTREIIVTDSSGNELVIFGGEGTNDGQFNVIEDVAVDSTGRIYVTGDNQIVRFTSAGVFDKWWGKCLSGSDCDTVFLRAKDIGCTQSTCFCGGSCKVGANGVGSLAGQYNGQGFITFDSADKLYATDPGNNRVQVYNSAMTFQLTFGTVGSGNGQFSGSAGIGIKNSNGHTYVADSGNNRIQEFTSAGAYLAQTGSLGTGNGQFTGLVGLAVDQSNEDVYAADSFNNRIQRFNSAFVFQDCFGNGVLTPQASCAGGFSAAFGDQSFNTPQDVFIDSGGNAYVSDSGNNKVEKSNAGNFLTRFGVAGTTNGKFRLPVDVAVDDVNNVIYVVDEYNDRIQKFNMLGAFLLSWGTTGSGNGQFSFPLSAAVDSGGNVYVSDAGNVRIQKFSSSGTYLAQGDNSGGVCSPRGLAFNSVTNRIAMADDCNGDIELFNTNLVFQTSFTNSMSCPTGIATDTSGNYHITDNCNSKVYETDLNGNPLSDFGTFGTAAGQLYDPVDIYVDSVTGYIYVVDTVNGIMVYNSAGVFLYFLGTSGTGDRSVKTGEFNSPFGIGGGSPLFIADSVSDIVEVFDLCGNGIVEAPEECDDGNLADGDGCSATCKLQPIPEFSTVTMIIAVIGALAGIFVLRRHL